MAAVPVAAARRTRHHHPLANRCVLAVLRSPLHALLDPGLRELRYTGRRSGRHYAVPVMYAHAGDRYIVLVGDAPAKTWWRNFASPAPVQVCRGRVARRGTGRIIRPGEDGYLDAARAYTARHGLVPQPGERLLVIDVPATDPRVPGPWSGPAPPSGWLK
jgi:hypothetical protein